MKLSHFAVGTLTLFGLAASIPAEAADKPTYAKDVAPIFQKNCQECHRPGEAVPMSLISYDDVRPWVKSIKKAVNDKTMPPWHADPSVGEWKNDRRLTEAEIATIANWADSGAEPGDPKDMPAPLPITEGWKIGKPDVVFTFAEDEVLPASLEDEYHYVVMKTDFKEDRWVKAVECRPGNLAVVHHIIAFAKPGNMSIKEGQEVSGAQGEGFSRGKDEKKGRKGRRGGLGGVSALGGMAPGTAPHVMPPGEAIFIAAGSDIVFQMHYHKEPGKEERDRSSIGMIFADYPVKKMHRGDAIANVFFSIPPNAENHEVSGSLTLEEDIELSTVMPHMHLRGKDMKVWIQTPDGQTKDLIWVPKYDFNWQTIYQLKEPMLLPKGTKLFAKAHYNNSASNPANPDPNATVRFGEPTTAEMMFAFLSYTYPGENLNAYDPSFAPKSAGAAGAQ